MDVWLTSDVAAPWQGQVAWQLATLSGEVVESGKVDASLAAQESKQVFSRAFNLAPEQRRSLVFQCQLKQGGQVVTSTVTTFIASKHLELVDPQLKAEVSQSGDQAVIALSATSLARFVELSLAGADVVFSDNYFDLSASQPAQVRCPIPAGWDLEKVRQSLVVTSLYQSF